MSERTRVTCFVSSVAVALLTAGTAWGLDGDANLDGVVDVRDTEAVESRFGCPVGEGHFACDVADVNRDGAVNPFDLGYVNARLGRGEETLRIGPMEGLTTAWHAAPAETAVRWGTTLAFRVTASDQARVEWNGAEEVGRNGFDSTARCALGQLGPQLVQVTVTGPDGEHLDLSTLLQVVDVPLAQIKLAGISPSVSPLDVDENSSNEVTMEYYFGESIASLTELGPGRYVTSVDRTLALAAVGVVPPAFAPLMEWRVDGIPYDMGAVGEAKFLGVGAHVVSGGPIARQQEIHVDTYSVTITGEFEGDIIPEGVPVTFEAVTDPAGYEELITWLSSTKYGTAVPVLGQGPRFTVQFDDTWGPEDGWQWLGVKGDNFALGQDQKSDRCRHIPSIIIFCPGETVCPVALGENRCGIVCTEDVNCVKDPTPTEYQCIGAPEGTCCSVIWGPLAENPCDACPHPGIADGNCPEDEDECEGLPDGTPCTDDGNECTDDVCMDEVCTHPNEADGTECTDDGNECTDDVCMAGVCTHPDEPDGTECMDDGSVCTDDVCMNGACTHPNLNWSCEGLNPCTEVGGFCTLSNDCLSCSCSAVGGECSSPHLIP